MYRKFGKRLFDLIVSIILLVLFSPIFLVVFVLISLNDGRPVFYRQKRIGKNFKEFYLYKFRTMIIDADKIGPFVTSSDDKRVTKLGKILRKLKIDRFPQLFNVINGDMSIVGPHPEVKKYINSKEYYFKEILKVKPGIIDNSYKIINDEEILMSYYYDSEEAYINKLLPKKINIYLEYVRNLSFVNDLKIILKTIFTKLLNRTRIRLLLMIIDILIIFASITLAFLFYYRFEVSNLFYINIFKSLIVLSVIRLFLFHYFKLFKISLKYFRFHDYIRLILALLLSSLMFWIIVILFKDNIFKEFPVLIIFIEFFISLFIFLIFKSSKRILYEYIYNKNLKPTLIVADLDEADKIINNLYLSNKYKPIVILNDKINNINLNGVKILDYKTIQKLYKGLEVAVVGSGYNIEDIFEQLKMLNINEIKMYHGVMDKNEQLNNNLIKDISIEDLLARKPKDIDTNKIEEFIENKVILITGAGGSIGSELARLCVKYKAKKLLLLDNSEFNLYKIEQELTNFKIEPLMINIVNKHRIEKIFKNNKIDIVLHAAAYKHVPLVESNVEEAIENNIIGTKNVIDLSIEYSVKKVVLISTDKAVRPTNVMGATKRVCELYAQNVKSNNTEIVAVRFGNVLGSSGSVIPRFKEQILNGGPVTVTHPEITRYFMLISEACSLVLQAAAIGKGGEIFILDMGKPIKIVDLAKKMIELSGKNDVKIIFTGLRPGEKLYEELLINESDKKTQYNSIMVANVTKYDIERLNQDIEELLVTNNKIKKLKYIVPEFNHKI